MSICIPDSKWYPRRERRMSEVRSQAMMDVIKSFINKQNSDLPFYVADFSDIVYKVRYWRSKLPNITPFYAVKCNSDPMLLRLLVSLGMKFDCASKGEIEAVLDAGAETSDIIYAHPFKSVSYLRFAAAMDINLMTFDCEQELLKISKVHPAARLVLRIRIPDVKAGFPLSNKFGCEVQDARNILLVAQSLGMNIVGVSFHVGSLCEQPWAYAKAIGLAKQVFDAAEEVGYHLTLLDIGGGFLGATDTYDIFDKMCHHIRQGLEEHFPEGCGVRVIAEPGCYIACSAYTLCTKIIGKKVGAEYDAENKECYKTQCFYYMNDGVYGSFGYGFEKYGYRMRPLLTKLQLSGRPLLRSKLWGCTCCSSDCIVEDSILPEMEVGEYVAFDNMGAYTQCLTTCFNGFPRPLTHYIFPPQGACPAALMAVAYRPDKLPSFEDFCRELGSNKLKAFIKIQEYICHDDSNDDLFRKG